MNLLVVTFPLELVMFPLELVTFPLELVAFPLKAQYYSVLVALEIYSVLGPLRQS